MEILLVSPEISLTSVVKCCGVVVVNQRGVKKHELRLKVRSMPITVPDAIVDLSMAIRKSVYRMILGGLDEQVVMTSLIKGLF